MLPLGCRPFFGFFGASPPVVGVDNLGFIIRPGIFIFQQKFVKDYPREADKKTYKPTITPIDLNFRLWNIEKMLHQTENVSTPSGKTHLFVSYMTKYYICCKCGKLVHP